jgi:hypothetical protein
MTIRSRMFTYQGTIRVSRSDLRLVREGRKTCTIRLGTASVASEIVTLTDGRDGIQVRILGVDASRVFDQISQIDAEAEGFDSLPQLHEDLRTYYGDVDPSQPVTVINFRRLDLGYEQTALFYPDFVT